MNVDSEREPVDRPPGEDDEADEAEDEALPDDEGIAVDDPAATGANSALPPKLESWRRRSAAGAILTGFALGLQEALETRKDEPSIVLETSGDPPKDLPVEAEFEYGRPRQSVVQIRPWLLPDQADQADQAEQPEKQAPPAGDEPGKG